LNRKNIYFDLDKLTEDLHYLRSGKRTKIIALIETHENLFGKSKFDEDEIIIRYSP